MDVKLSKRAAEIVAEQVESGRFKSAEEAVEAGSSMQCNEDGMDIDAILEAHREEIAEGERAVDRGDWREVTPEFIRELRERIANRASTT